MRTKNLVVMIDKSALRASMALSKGPGKYPKQLHLSQLYYFGAHSAQKGPFYVH